MLGPYRVPGPVEVDFAYARLETRCSAVRTVGCDVMPPAPPRFPASIGPAPKRRRVPVGFLKALTAAATLLLLVASASLAAVASSLVIAGLRYAPSRASLGAIDEQVQSAGAPSPHAEAGDGVPLAALGPETHAVDELWRRAARRAAEGVDVTLVRASLPRAAMAAWTRDPSYLRVLPAQSSAGLQGLRIVDLGAGSAPARAGVRAGDVVTAVNGYALASPEDGLRAFAGAGEGRALVAEIERDGHRIALRVDWKA
jgi:membrane-associated protease RseP (regulator of RpoE activity)